MVRSLVLTALPLLISFSLSSGPGERYNAIKKPTWTPPPIVFPLVWTTLYLLMGYASARVAGTAGLLSIPILLYALQLILNISWTPVFFGQGKYRRALTILRVLILAVLATMVVFWQIDTTAGILLLPYLIWLGVAHELNRNIVRLNS
jgi:tryptophan-rich sensory protein